VDLLHSISDRKVVKRGRIPDHPEVRPPLLGFQRLGLSVGTFCHRSWPSASMCLTGRGHARQRLPKIFLRPIVLCIMI
jgi:hypothetical protein